MGFGTRRRGEVGLSDEEGVLGESRWCGQS